MFLLGANERAAVFNGLRVTWTKFAVYLLCGTFAGLAGVAVVLRLGSGGLVLGDNTLLMAIAAVVLGGTSITGGEGSAVKTASGVAVIVLLDKGLNMLGLSFYDQAIVLGIVMVLGSAFNAWLYNIFGNMRLGPARRIISPDPGQIQAPINKRMAKAAGIGGKDTDLSVFDPSRRPRILARHAGRCSPLLQEAGLIHHQHPVRIAKRLDAVASHQTAKLIGRPG